MKIALRKQFINNLQAIRSHELADDIEFLVNTVESSNNISLIPGIKKLKGYEDYYRIRLDDYRIGIKLSGDTVILVCIYHRAIIYQNFP